MVKGDGGDGGTSYGGMSFRNRKAMLDAINYELSKPHLDRDFDLKYGQEDVFFITRLRELERLKGKKYNVATKEQTYSWGAGESFANSSVLVVSGTLAGLPFKERDVFLQFCPGMRLFCTTNSISITYFKY